MRATLLGLCLISLLLPAVASAQDLALAAPSGDILAPLSGCDLGPTETVKVRIFNFGTNLPAGTSFNVAFTVNGGVPNTEMVVLGSTLLANSSLEYTFVNTANLSVPGTYSLAATVTLPGDINPSNDTLTGYQVTNDAPAVGGVVSGPGNVCPGAGGTLSLSGRTGSVVRWERSDDGGSVWTAVANTDASLTFSSLAGDARFRAVVENGACGEAVSTEKAVDLVEPPALVLTAPVQACSGSDQMARVDGVPAGAAIAWSAQNATLVGATDGAQVGFTAPAAPGQATLTATVNEAGCVFEKSASVPVQAALVPTLTAPSEVCGTGSAQLSVQDFGATARYYWTVQGGTLLSGAGTTTVEVAPASSSEIEARVLVVQDGSLCEGEAQATLPVVQGTLSPPVVTSNAPLCEGDTLALKATGPTGATWSWSGPDGFSAEGDAVSLPEVTLSASGTYTAQAAVGTCTTEGGRSDAVVVFPRPPAPGIDAPKAVAPKANGEASVVYTAGGALSWEVENGTLQVAADGRSATFTAGDDGEVVLRAVETSAQGCESTVGEAHVLVCGPSHQDAPECRAAPVVLAGGGCSVGGGPAWALLLLLLLLRRSSKRSSGGGAPTPFVAG